MMVLDAPSIHRRAYPLVAYKLGAKLSLYYNGTQMLPTAWADGGQYNEGGNGDGTLVYAKGDVPYPSLRLKYMRAGMNDIEWVVAARKRRVITKIPVKDAFTWSKNEAEYQLMRKLIAARL